MDTLVSERLTASPRIFHAFGLCGIASLSEFAMQGSIEDEIYGYDDEEKGEGWKLNMAEKAIPTNDLSIIEKLEYALQIAEAVADLHGYADGLILHLDLKQDQFFWNRDKSMIKLNDFSRATFLMWDDSKQEYCPCDENEYRRVRKRLFLCLICQLSKLAHIFHLFML